MANWADDNLWSGEDNQSTVCAVASDLILASPWGEETNTILDQDSPLIDNFCDLSVDECNRLCDSKLQASIQQKAIANSSEQDNQVHQKLAFETDRQYLSKLESKLAKLYKLSGKEMKRNMLKQVSDRASELFTTEADRQDTSLDKQIVNNLVVLRLFPEQPITTEEKLELVKNDQLTAETTNREQSADMSTVVCEAIPSNPRRTETNKQQ
ncbi:uncharacterized protein [Watersipora subatra]|uniref:uncharacterized protein n=1 Tax=Watersipora subatra TaxID=2589382 RepID=UPI00355B6F78